MSNVYSKMLTEIESSLSVLELQAKSDTKKFRQLVLKAFGAEITDRFVRKVKAGEW